MAHSPTTDITMSVPSAAGLIPVVAELLDQPEQSISLELYQHAMHDTYLAEAGKTSYYFKLYRKGLTDQAKIATEIDFLNFLADRKLPVTGAKAGKGQDPIVEIPCPEGTRYGVLFSAVDGKFIPEPSENHCRQYGRYLAKLHNYGAEFLVARNSKLAHLQPVIQATAHLKELVESHPWIQSKTRTTLLNAVTEIQALNDQFQALPQSLIHGDAHLGNVRFHRNAPAMFDFDLMTSEASAYDLAVYRWSRLISGAPPDETRKAWGALLAGYRIDRELSTEERNLIPALTTLRHLWFVSYMLESSRTHGRVWFENSQAKLLKHLELSTKGDEAA